MERMGDGEKEVNKRKYRARVSYGNLTKSPPPPCILVPPNREALFLFLKKEKALLIRKKMTSIYQLFFGAQQIISRPNI